MTAGLAMAGTLEPIRGLHPNLPGLYRRKVEALEQALADPAAATALRGLVDTLLVYPGEWRAA